MSFQLPSKMSVRADEGPRWSGAAVLVEAMLLLVFLIASLAVFTQMFGAAMNRADDSARLTAAVAAASDTAEKFTAYPDRVAARTAVGDLLVVCDITEDKRASGTMYHANISVYDAEGAAGAAGSTGAASAASAADGEPLYSVSTARFVSEVG